MRILIDPGDFTCRNLGDVAMMQVAGRRLRALWPAASLEMLVHDPDALARLCPGLRPVPEAGREQWFGEGELLGRVYDALPAATARAVARAQERVRRRHPRLLDRAIRARRRLRGAGGSDLAHFLQATRQADMLVVNGQGTITDHLHDRVLSLLRTIEMFVARGAPVAMVGQGIGPLEHPDLRAAARRVLPSVALIALREQRRGPALLASLGIAAERVVVTGDDAIELAHAARAPRLGRALGVNLRLARSSAVDPALVAPLRAALRAVAGELDAPLIPVPIASGAQGDAASIRMLLHVPGDDDASPVAALDDGARLDSPQAVIEQVGRCRVVVTGAYHAAVFALAQGIPAVCLAASPYFADKFLGLADQFGSGCAVVSLRETDAPDAIAAAVRDAWAAADAGRAALLDAAERQIAASQAAFRRLAHLLPAPTSAPA